MQGVGVEMTYLFFNLPKDCCVEMLCGDSFGQRPLDNNRWEHYEVTKQKRSIVNPHFNKAKKEEHWF